MVVVGFKNKHLLESRQGFDFIHAKLLLHIQQKPWHTCVQYIPVCGMPYSTSLGSESRMEGRSIERTPLKACQRDWKQELRKSCLRRVNQERHQLLWKIRSVGKSSEAPKEVAASAFSEILEDEMNKFKMTTGVQHTTSQPQCIFSRLWGHDASRDFLELAQEDYEELMTAMEKIFHEGVEVEQRQKGMTDT